MQVFTIQRFLEGCDKQWNHFSRLSQPVVMSSNACPLLAITSWDKPTYLEWLAMLLVALAVYWPTMWKCSMMLHQCHMPLQSTPTVPSAITMYHSNFYPAALFQFCKHVLWYYTMRHLLQWLVNMFSTAYYRKVLIVAWYTKVIYIIHILYMTHFVYASDNRHFGLTMVPYPPKHVMELGNLYSPVHLFVTA
jgi:hypothetical protein